MIIHNCDPRGFGCDMWALYTALDSDPTTQAEFDSGFSSHSLLVLQSQSAMSSWTHFLSFYYYFFPQVFVGLTELGKSGPSGT